MSFRSCARWDLPLAEARDGRRRPRQPAAESRTEHRGHDCLTGSGEDEETLMTDVRRGVKLIASRIRFTPPEVCLLFSKGFPSRHGRS
jgi:hypothetical protein